MRAHPFDAVSFVFGVIFTAVAVVGLTDVATLSLVDLRWLGPAALVLVGAVLVVSAARHDEPRAVATDGDADDHGQGA
jgi:putative Mn2+ efflux pump MntP